jgi:hypothetical protein
MDGLKQQIESEMAVRYAAMLEPLRMYVENLHRMIRFQQGRFYELSKIRCNLENKNVEDREPDCNHIACPRCWHRATVAYMQLIRRAGSPPGLRLRVIEDVPPALDHVAFVTKLTKGEEPWVHDVRCVVNDTGVRRLIVLSAISTRPQPDEETATICGENVSPMSVRDFSSVDDALDAWFIEAPPPFAYPDFEQYVRNTKDYVFPKAIHQYTIRPGYVRRSSAEPEFLDL